MDESKFSGIIYVIQRNKGACGKGRPDAWMDVAACSLKHVGEAFLHEAEKNEPSLHWRMVERITSSDSQIEHAR